MSSDPRQTIFAVATPPGVGGVGIVRISGPDADPTLAALTPGSPLPAPRVASLRALAAPDGSPLDQALVLRFPQGGSYTGEAMVELHVHGSVATVTALLRVLADCPGCRLAERGEFTRRALINGRMDLAEVEALGELLQAETDAQRRQAVAGLKGEVTRRIEAWRDRLLECCALVEVTIDWVDEEVPGDTSSEVAAALAVLRREIAREIAGAVGRERLAAGFEVAVIGSPNVGKSSFLNYLAGHEAVITSPIPGTTRDVIELRYDLGGLPVRFLDMAGLRETSDPVERIGVERAFSRARAADLRLHLHADDTPVSPLAEGLMTDGDIEVWTKRDLFPADRGFSVSAKTGDGMASLIAEIAGRLGSRIDPHTVVSTMRQREQLEACHAALDSAERATREGVPEIAAEQMRVALGALGAVVGATGVERVLDRVFAGFCLGK